MKGMGDRAHAQQRARIARRTRQLERTLDSSSSKMRRARMIPSSWLPADNVNFTIYRRSTLAELLSRAWTADLVNRTDCYGKSEDGCDPAVCDRNCLPLDVEPRPNSVFFFAGVGKSSEYRRVFQDGGPACWMFMSSVVSDRKTDDADYMYKRYWGRGWCTDMRRAVVHFRDEVTEQLVWALVYLPQEPVLAGRRIFQNVCSSVWAKKPAGWADAAVARKRPTHGPFDVSRLLPGDVYLLPSDFSFDQNKEDFMRLDQDGRGLTFLRAWRAGDPKGALVIQQEKCGSRLLARIGRICSECGCSVARSQREHEKHVNEHHGKRCF